MLHYDELSRVVVLVTRQGAVYHNAVSGPMPHADAAIFCEAFNLAHQGKMLSQMSECCEADLQDDGIVLACQDPDGGLKKIEDWDCKTDEEFNANAAFVGTCQQRDMWREAFIKMRAENLELRERLRVY